MCALVVDFRLTFLSPAKSDVLIPDFVITKESGIH